MSERKTWADVLDVLPMEKRPKSPTDARAVLAVSRGEFVYSWRDSPSVVVHRPLADDAHAHIRIAAEDYVRDWCKKEAYSYVLTEFGGACAIRITPNLYNFSIISHAPDLPTALYHAVAYCKEHQQ